MSNQVSHFGKLILRKSFTTDGPPTLLTDVGGVTKSEVHTMRNDQRVWFSHRMEAIA
jgi:hypothetical protein